jgi:TIR domain
MYDFYAFFSYKRHPLTDEWHQELMRRTQFWLSHALGIPDAPIFFDVRSIDNGTLFDQVIDTSLRKSMVLISILSPLYFTSAHCLAEINTFMAREDHLRLARGTLISCVRFHDGANYPMPFKDMQSEDFAPFANPAKAFWSSHDSVGFELRIRDFATTIAKKINVAPPWTSDFPSPVFNPKACVSPNRIERPSTYLGAHHP